MLFGLDDLRAGNAQLAAEIEQVVLDLGEATRHFAGQTGHAEDHADRAVGLVDGAIGLDARVILAYPAAVAEAGGAVVAGARVDPAQAIAHTSLRNVSRSCSVLQRCTRGPRCDSPAASV